MNKVVRLPILAITLISPLEAKRSAPKPVPPIEHCGIRYTAPFDDGLRGYIVAVDCLTNKPLWSVTIFKNKTDSNLEYDVQMVYIQSITLDGDCLLIRDERSGIYRLNLSTRKVTLVSSRPNRSTNHMR